MGAAFSWAWGVLWIAGIPASLLAWWLLMRAGRAMQTMLPTCPSCGYSLAGLRPDGACPECGRPDAVRDAATGATGKVGVWHTIVLLQIFGALGVIVTLGANSLIMGLQYFDWGGVVWELPFVGVAFLLSSLAIATPAQRLPGRPAVVVVTLTMTTTALGIVGGAFDAFVINSDAQSALAVLAFPFVGPPFAGYGMLAAWWLIRRRCGERVEIG